jgi:hypothetical protein
MNISPGYTGSGGVVEVNAPEFYVEIWTPHRPTWSESNRVWECAEYELSECDVDEALRWAQAETPSDGLSCCVLYATYRRSVDSDACDVHIRLYGKDPEEPTNVAQIQFHSKS